MKRYYKSALLATLALSLAGCGGGSSTSGSSTSSSNILKYGLSGIEGNFSPFIFSNTYDGYVCSLIFEPLVTVDASGEYVPYLADWELSDDKLTYTFTLKDGIKFSDGTDMTAEDVAYSYSVPAEEDYAGPRLNVANAIAGIKVVDDKTVAFTMTSASPANIQNFTYGIMSKEYYAHSSFEELNELNQKPMGSGKFVLEDGGYASKQYVKLKTNENYWDSDAKPKIDGVYMLEVADDTVLSSLESGEIDMCMPAAKAENVESIESMSNAHLVSYLGNGYTFMCFNTTRPTLAQTEVRQALMYALDRKSFLKAEYGSDDLVSLGMAPISPVSWAYPGNDALNAYDYDLDKAAKMLDDAGWKDTDGDGIRDKDGTPLHLNWLVYTDSTWPGTLSSMAYDSWHKIGVDLEITQMDFNTVSSMTMDPEPGEKDFDIYTMGFSLSADPDPTGGLYDADAYVAGGFNASGFCDERSQELIAEGLAEFDQEKRAEIYKEWAIRQNELVPTAIIAYRSEIWGIADRVHGLDDLNSYQDFTSFISDVTLD
ncbi:MAG: ABC transporter substrate-binding protein [Bulleidia sp.]|nr:ABC transporter substrate-binding protein [Bulleidia sp.]